MPSNLKELLSGYKRVLIPEMNTGQLVKIIRAEYLIDAQSMTKISGQPYKIKEIEAGIAAQLELLK
jgi:2-oxoglutarate ferredoxin oxidoreductase subunit alpha